MTKSNVLGGIQVVMISFGGKVNNLQRIQDLNLGGGALLDIGIYTLHVTDMLFAGEDPLSITATGHCTDSGVDETVCITLLYSGKRIANLTISTGKFVCMQLYVN